MLGFAMRAGKVVIGTELVCTSMSARGKNRARIVLISSTASDGTKKKVSFKGEFYGVETRIIDIDGDELGRLLGKLYAPAAVAITVGFLATANSSFFASAAPCRAVSN